MCKFLPLRINVLLVLAIACVVALGCKTRPRKAKEIVLVAYSKSACKGKCPAYNATFYSSGRFVYEGLMHTPLKGTYTYEVPVKTISGIQAEAKKIKYHNLKVDKALAMDFPTTTTTISYEGKTTTFDTQMRMPDALKELQKKIETEISVIITEQPPVTSQPDTTR